MKKYILKVNEEDEGEVICYEVNIEAFLQSLDTRDIGHIQQALDDGKEITMEKINSKRLKELEVIGEKMGIDR